MDPVLTTLAESRYRPLTTEELKARLDLCREYGVAVFEEGANGVRFTLMPRAADRAQPEPLSEGEAAERRKAEFRRVATLHSRGGR